MGTTNTYFDSSLLVKLYHFEPGSMEAAMRAAALPCLPLPFIAEIELRNTLRVLHGRNVISHKKMSAALHAIEEDIKKGQLRKLHIDPAVTERLALSLSENHTSKFFSRTLDILHVANALAAGLSLFITADLRQAKLAKAAGLNVELIEIPSQQ